MSDQTVSQSHAVDSYQKLQVIHNPDGTLTRLVQDPHTSPASDPTLPISVLTKDVIINQSNNTWLRIFLPRKALDHNDSSSNKKLPLIVFFHGSGFILLSAASSVFHDLCVKIANDAEAVVASIEYRLAPEHRLPAAYDDAMEALHWIKTSREEWLTRCVDYSNCYVMGNSAGATIAYHAALRAAAETAHLEPLKIRGLILRQPYFGGTKRTGSELRLVDDPVFPLSVNDLIWELALPIGADRDHEYSNPTVGDGPGKLEKIREVGWRVLMSGCDGDPLVDRERELLKIMEEKGLEVVSDFEGGGYHGVEFAEPLRAKKLIGLVKIFVHPSSA